MQLFPSLFKSDATLKTSGYAFKVYYSEYRIIL